MAENILEIKDLVVHYETDEGCVNAVNNVSLTLGRKTILGLVGETGAGKTTTALAVLNLIPNPPGVIKHGSILLNGVDILKLSENELEEVRGNDVAMIFQDPMTALNPVLTIGEQIAESVMLHGEKKKEKALERARKMLEQVGISGSRSGDYPHQLSGGMRQRVVIAIALACNPKLLIADEPTTALDVTIQAQILNLIKELNIKFDTSMLLITHDLGVVADVCDRVAVMYAGRIVENGTADEVFNHTLHPYTEGLFNSLPNLRKRGEELIPIRGMMPDPMELPGGCAFAPRCPYVMSKCEKIIPVIKSHGSHRVACLAYEDSNFQLRRNNQ